MTYCPLAWSIVACGYSLSAQEEPAAGYADARTWGQIDFSRHVVNGEAMLETMREIAHGARKLLEMAYRAPLAPRDGLRPE
jgi:hypothetical protein